MKKPHRDFLLPGAVTFYVVYFKSNVQLLSETP